MAPSRNRYLLLNHLFLGSLLLLVVNDHLLKSMYGNWWTGKLSDAAGIVLLPLVLRFLLPRLREHSLWISALFFAWWKSPLSDPFIDVYNGVMPIGITRVVDYSDLLVLCLLPIPEYVMNRLERSHVLAIRRVHPALVLLPAMFAFMATSPPYNYRYVQSNGNLRCYNCYVDIKLSQAEIVNKLAAGQIVFDSVRNIEDSAYAGVDTAQAPVKLYTINELVIEGDTLQSVDFTMVERSNGKTRVYFTGMEVDEYDSDDWRLAKKLRKLYRKQVFRELRAKVE